MSQLKWTGGQTEKVTSAELNNLAYANKNSILSGCEVTAQTSPNMTVQVSSGTAFFSETNVSVSAVSSLTIASNTSSFNRLDLIAINNIGTVSVIQGTASSNPYVPDYDPELYIIVAYITVQPNTTLIASSKIKDIRVLNVGGSGGSGGGVGGVSKYVQSYTSQTSVSVTHNLDDEDVVVQIINSDGTTNTTATVDRVDENNITVTLGSSSTGYVVVHGGMATTLPANSGAGKIIYDNGTDYVTLAAGNSGEFLQSNGVAAPSWEEVQINNVGVALGETIYKFLQLQGNYINSGYTVTDKFSTSGGVKSTVNSSSTAVFDTDGYVNSLNNLVSGDTTLALAYTNLNAVYTEIIGDWANTDSGFDSSATTYANFNHSFSGDEGNVTVYIGKTFSSIKSICWIKLKHSASFSSSYTTNKYCSLETTTDGTTWNSVTSQGQISFSEEDNIFYVNYNNIKGIRLKFIAYLNDHSSSCSINVYDFQYGTFDTSSNLILQNITVPLLGTEKNLVAYVDEELESSTSITVTVTDGTNTVSSKPVNETIDISSLSTGTLSAYFTLNGTSTTRPKLKGYSLIVSN